MNIESLITYTLNRGEGTNLLIIYGVQRHMAEDVEIDLHGLKIDDERCAKYMTSLFEEIPSPLAQADSDAPMLSLFLDDNQLTRLPACIFPRIAHSLRLLTLHKNQLTILPDDVCSCTKLKSLRLDDNLLTSLPFAIGDGCVSLAEVHLDNNPCLLELPESLGRLRFLHHLLMKNVPLVTTLPRSFAKASSLEFIAADEETLIEPEQKVWGAGGEAIRQWAAAATP